MSGTASTPQPTRPPAPGNMRPVHDGADPEGEARARAEGTVRRCFSWTTWILIVVALVLVPGDPTWRWWTVLVAVWVAGALLEWLVFPRVARRLAARWLAHQSRRGGL